MNGMVFRLFEKFIVEVYDYVGWSKIQDTFFKAKGKALNHESDFFTLLTMAKDILREDELKLLTKFGKYCFMYLMEHSDLNKPEDDDVADVFFYSDPLLNLKVKKLDEMETLGWEIDGELKLSETHKLDNGKSVFCSFIDGFLKEGDKYYNHQISLDHFQTLPNTYDACKITVFVK